MINGSKISKSFKLKEFQCRCCGQVKVDSVLVEKLQKLRDTIGKPIIINSGYRCPVHNKKVGGAPRSQHMLGTAVDIRVNGMTPAQVAAVAEKVGFTGIGIYKTFTHCDVRAGKARWNG